MNNEVEEHLSPNHSVLLILCERLKGNLCSMLCSMKDTHRKCIHDSHSSPISSSLCLSLAYVDKSAAPSLLRQVPGQECNFYHFIIGHTGLSRGCSCSQPNASTSESSTHSCFVLVLSFHPQISHTCSPESDWYKGISVLPF